MRLLNAKNLVTEFGSINLSVKVETEKSRLLIFSFSTIMATFYPIGNLTFSFENTFLNGNWVKYAETSSEGFWSKSRKNIIDDRNFSGKNKDDSNNFGSSSSFEAIDLVGDSLRTVSNLNFKIKIDR